MQVVDLSEICALRHEGAMLGFFGLCHCVQTDSGTYTVSYARGTRGSHRSKREADHSPLSSAEVQNVWSYISIPRIRHGVVLS